MDEKQKEALAKLRQPFAPNQISKLCRPTKRDNPKGSCKVCGGYHGLPAISLDYVGHAALTDRLLDVDPLWSWEPMAVDAQGVPLIDKDGGMWIKLTVCGVTRLGYGDAQGKQGGDAMKERIGDALRNAAMRFGAALDLWHKGDLHVDDSEPSAPQGKTTPAPASQSGSQAKLSAVQAKLFPTVKAHLDALFGDDVAAKKKECLAISGMEDYRKLDGEALKELEHKLRLTVESDKDMPL